MCLYSANANYGMPPSLRTDKVDEFGWDESTFVEI
jgi:hypothetical protein